MLNLLRNQSDATHKDGCLQRISSCLSLIIDETRFLFDDYTGRPCAVSIKLLVPGDNPTPKVHTYRRDQKSQLIRRSLYSEPKDYAYDEHSPFKELIFQSTAEYYINNDLRRAAANGTYYNGNRHWTKLYNATLIVPIREPSVVTRENLLGFLCIDSISASFDEVGAGYPTPGGHASFRGC